MLFGSFSAQTAMFVVFFEIINLSLQIASTRGKHVVLQFYPANILIDSVHVLGFLNRMDQQGGWRLFFHRGWFYFCIFWKWFVQSLYLLHLHRKFEYSSRGIKASPVICQVCKARITIPLWRYSPQTFLLARCDRRRYRFKTDQGQLKKAPRLSWVLGVFRLIDLRWLEHTLRDL